MSSMSKVAREANVAVSTVSLTLNHRERVKPETRKRIEEAMEKLGYRPHKRSPRARVTSASLRVAFIYTQDALDVFGHGLMSSYCRDMISGMQEMIAGTPCSLSIFRGADHIDHDVMVNEQVNANEFDAVILFGADAQNGYLERLQKSGLALVVVNQPSPYGQFSCLTLDYYGGAKRAVEHLVSLGHRRFAIAFDDGRGKWLTDQVCTGARTALKQHGLKPVIDVPATRDLENQDQVRKFCKQCVDEKVTALLAGDHMAIRCADELDRQGVRVPEGLSIVGFDDRGIKTAGGKRVTTIGYDKRRMGRLAIRMIKQLVHAKSQIHMLMTSVATRLVEGETSGPVPNER